MIPRASRKQRGFTLIEVLAATAMVAGLAASLYASLHIAFEARKQAVGLLEPVRKSHQSIDLIRADLRSAVTPKANPNNNLVLAGSFVGTSGQGMMGSGSDDLIFCGIPSDIEPAESVGEIKQIEYSCDPSPDGKDQVLVRRITSNLLSPTTPEPKQEIICRGVKSFMLRYYDGMTWLTSWDSTTNGNVLPQAVEVTLELTAPSTEDMQKAGGGNIPTSRVLSMVINIPCGTNMMGTTTQPGDGS